MSNKKFHKLWPADQMIRELKSERVTSQKETLLTIELINGFELFNTRPYHNFETWSNGYRVSDGTITVESEDLDDALRLFKKKSESPQKHIRVSDKEVTDV